jgi:DHA2 family multidrug resistance protein-like MFS transporter
MAYELGAGLGIALFGLILTRSYSSSIAARRVDGQARRSSLVIHQRSDRLAQSLPAVPAHSLIAAAKTAFISAHSRAGDRRGAASAAAGRRDLAQSGAGAENELAL